jgi:hypothetical protein
LQIAGLSGKKEGGWFMLINLNTLNQMFKDRSDKSHLSIDGCCQSCGRDFTIDIHHHSSGGYGLIGGVLCEQDADQLIARCEACYHNSPEL